MPSIDTKLETLPRVTIKYAEALRRLGIETVEDFLLHFPFRYEDYSERVLIGELVAGSTATIMGEVTRSKLVRTWKKKMMITEVFVSDETGTARAVWFNQPYVSDSLIQGKGVRMSGKVSQDAKGLFFSNPAWELSSREPTNTGRLVPIYPETEGLTSKWLRWQMSNIISFADTLEDPIPSNILGGLHLPTLSEAVRSIHFPKTLRQAELAQKRFAFQQMYLVQLMSQREKISWEQQSAVSIPFNERSTKKFVQSLPFSLTDAQRKAAFQILKDLEKPKPMNRLLNGDVGSGKTVVAAMACLGTADAGYQVSLMAPTEVLARQHFESICKLFEKQNVSVGLLTNAYKKKNNSEFLISNLESNQNEQISKIKTFKIQSKFSSEDFSRDILLSEIKSGKIDLVIGTHALIQKDVSFKNLALVIVDEQHRFGVDQRAYLQKEISRINDGLKGKIPHLLSMTATPIPRTLAMAFFGNLNLSVLDEVPKNRKIITTALVGARERQKTYDFIRSEIKKGRQAFVIFPLVEESRYLSELKAATQEHKRLSEEVFPDFKLALLHGKLKSQEKEKVMQDFKDRKFDILVATSVVEVGIDVPNATVMVIEDSERFGLSQLHQFRGRVGRSEHQSYCFLFTGSSASKPKDRLKALVKYSSGFDIAEKDFELRGPGEFLGTRQSGIPDIAMKHIANVRLVEIARDYAESTLQESHDLARYPLLRKELGKFQQDIHLE
jgi:ATP-dependent DNA helicase RecG